MFYQDKDEALRFGDVLTGYVLGATDIKEPTPNENYKIDINLPRFCAVLSPCCSIGQKKISLSPLIELRSGFFDNPYLLDDLTRINREMEPHESVSPTVWGGFSPEEKEKRLQAGRGYAFLELFVYEQNALFPKYTLNRRGGNVETGYYMIDFRDTYKISCEKILSPKEYPLHSKILQLSVQARSELREKIAYYYARIPQEDNMEE